MGSNGEPGQVGIIYATEHEFLVVTTELERDASKQKLQGPVSLKGSNIERTSVRLRQLPG